MDVAQARAVLGVSADADWVAIRSAYRRLIRQSHPDLAGPEGAARSAQLNAAYRTLSLARSAPTTPDSTTRPETGATHTRRGPRPRAAPPSPPGRAEAPPADVTVVESTIIMTSTPQESFRRLVEAAHLLGDISYIDRSAAIFEAILQLDDGAHASFVVSLDWSGHDAICHAWCTLEALDRAETLDPSGVIGQLVELMEG